MNRLSALYDRLDGATSTTAKIEAMAAYFSAAPPEDAAWVVYFLAGEKPTRIVSARALRAWVGAETGISDWLFAECLAVVGDLAETIALVLDQEGAPLLAPGSNLSLSRWVDERLLPLRGGDVGVQGEAVRRWWRELGRREICVLTKLLTGDLRVGVSRSLVVRALARASGQRADVIAERLAGRWTPDAAFFRRLMESGGPSS